MYRKTPLPMHVLQDLPRKSRFPIPIPIPIPIADGYIPLQLSRKVTIEAQMQ